MEDSPTSPSQRRQRRRSSNHGHRTYDDYREMRSHTRRQSSARRNSTERHLTQRPEAAHEKPRGIDSSVSVQPLPSPYQSPGTFGHEREPMLEGGTPTRKNDMSSDLGRKRSMVRPERRQYDPNDPNYYYRQHAKKMSVMPSTTGMDPGLEDDYRTASSNSTLKHGASTNASPINEKQDRVPERQKSKKLVRKTTRNDAQKQEAKEIRNQKIHAATGTPTLWGTYCHLVTFWCPNTVLRCFGMKNKEQQRAWREKMGLVSIILLVMLFVGFLTFGFTTTVCPNGGPLRLRVNKVGEGYMIFQGQAYDLTRSRHPLARGISDGGNVLWDMDEPHGGQDGSFLFQNVNGACKGLITPADGTDVPHDTDGNMAWYFPCHTFNQDGSSEPNLTIPYYLGYSCHTSRGAREDFYRGLHSSGDVYFTWDDIKNKSRNLMVYSGDVLDLDLLRWFNSSQVAWPSEFDEMRQNPALRGVDTTIAFSSGKNKQIAQCLQDIVKVGSIDTATVGCIASKVVLYVSLIFILSIVVIKFVLAILFQWFFCRKFAANKTSMGGDSKRRKQQIEDWTEDIYRPPPKMTDPVEKDRNSKRSSFLPTTSRFTSPYAIEKISQRNKAAPTTMASQQSTTRLVPGQLHNSNRSEATLPTYMDSQGKQSTSDRSSLMDYSKQASSTQRYSTAIHTDTDMSGPQGFIHEAVVPQPPPEWQSTLR